MPAPIPGCISKKGAATAPMPTASAGPIVGWRTHSSPHIPISKAANAMPVR